MFDNLIINGVDYFSDKEKNFGESNGPEETNPANGEPINMATGNEYHKSTDLNLLGPGLPMQFTRHYNSQSDVDSLLGIGWTTTFSENITIGTDRIVLREADGKSTHFIYNGAGQYISEADVVRIITPVTGGHQLNEPDGRELVFDTNGRLMSITDLNNNTQTLTYVGDNLSSVEDNFGRRFDFVYDTNGKLDTMTTPVGVFDYYVILNHLFHVTNPDTTVKSYYRNSEYNLVRVTNEEGVNIIEVTYDNQDRATSVEYAGGMYSVQADYPDVGSITATDSLGETTTFNIQRTHGITRVAGTLGTGCGTCATSLGSDYTLDDRLLITTSTDPEGNDTTYTYDDRGNVLTMTEAAGTSDARTTTYTYHPDYSLVTSITRGDTVITMDYDANGNLEEKTEQGSGVSRTTTYDYNALGQLIQINGPRTGVSDNVSFDYYPNIISQGSNRGMLSQITDGLGNVTYFRNYNGYGKPQESEDPNGVVTSYVYDTAGRLTSKTTVGYTTLFEYDNVGNLTDLHLPGGIDITYTYTNANLLEQIEDNFGNYIWYDYDTEGNRTREEIHSNGGALEKYVDYEYDGFNRLSRTIYPGGHDEDRSYDDNHNLTGLTDPNTNATTYIYDYLNRLTTMTEPGTTVTGYGYDHLDNLTSVTDPGGENTDYTYDDLGRLTQTDSPDTGQTTYSHDHADNITSKTDANGITVTYQYDTLNRLTDVEFPNSSENVTFGYDSGTNGIGRLTSMTDQAGSTIYSYNAMGLVTAETRTMDGETYSTGYTYDSGLKLETITYPSGLVVTYNRDVSGRITGTSIDGQAVTSGTTYLPFGPATGMTLGNSLVNISRNFNQRYQMTQNNVGALLDMGYTHDPSGNILSISGQTDPAITSGTTDYDYLANRLDQATGQDEASYSYDNNGIILSDGTRTFVYNQDNRLIRVEEGSTVLGEYFYDGLGRRVKKIAFGVTTHYHYDQTGNLIAETTGSGTPLRDIIYQNGERIAMQLYGTQAGIYYFLNDHLGTPHSVIDGSAHVVWQAAYPPFGKAQVITETIVNNFRFAGQYYDSETSLHYNYHRYYDPATGRYLTPDPIGLAGGINLYAYVQNNPVNFIDPTGEFLVSGATLIGYVYGPAIVVSGTAALYRLAPYTPALLDFTLGFFAPGPPPMTPAGAVGTGARQIYDQTFNEEEVDNKCP